MLLTIYHIQLTLNNANRACGVCGKYHMTDGRYQIPNIFTQDRKTEEYDNQCLPASRELQKLEEIDRISVVNQVRKRNR